METKRQAIMPYERPIIREENTKKHKKRKKKEHAANPFREFVRAQRLKKLKPVAAVLILAAVWYMLIGKDILPGFIDNFKGAGSHKVQEKQYYEAGCSEANLARMLALCCFKEEMGKAEETEGQTLELWYDKYYQRLSKEGIHALQKGNAFNLVTYKQLYECFRECFGTETASKVVAEKQSYQLYEIIGYLETALAKSHKGRLTYCDAGILATPSDEVPLEAWQVLTSEGSFYFEGLVIAPLKNQTVTLALCGSQILGVTEIKSSSCQVKSCHITSVEEEKASYQVGGLTFTYENKALKKEQEGGDYDLTLEGDKIVACSECAYEKVDTLVKTASGSITLEEAGTLPYKTLAVSDATDLDRFHSIEDLVYGVKVAYIKKGEEVTALKVVGQSGQQSIRVVLTDAEGSYVHKEITLTGDADYDLVYKGKASTMEKGSVWKSNSFKWEDDKSNVRFVPRQDSSLTITSIRKGEDSPSYKGIIEISPSEKGYVIVNEVDLEDYVAGVIPSEMPTSYPEEALKAQAVAARTYGASCMESSKFMAYGANVDDSTASQVYNRINANKTSYKAASETAGLVLKSGNSLISGKFFAASCGYTANFGEVWAGQSFPTDSPSYLSAEKQYEDKLDVGDLEKEEDFKKFISLTAADMDAYDEESPWFRWQVTLTEEELEKLVKTNLKAIYEKNSSLISYETAEGEKASSVIEDIGVVKDLEVRERGEGGNIMKLAVLGSKGTAVIETEYYIRSLFASTEDVSVNVERADQSEVKKAVLLPSAFFTIEEQKADADGSLQSITLAGGGSGHGVGLSQDGAKGMAEKGYDYKKILEHFYKDTQLVNLWDKK